MPFCTQCGVEIPEEVNYCPECGARMAPAKDAAIGSTKCCKQCGELMPADMFYCLNCGAPSDDKSEDFDAVQARVRMQFGVWKNKWTALLLCILLGWLGIHRFYEGKIVSGVLYLCTLGFFGVGWLIDIVRIACKPNPYRVK